MPNADLSAQSPLASLNHLYSNFPDMLLVIVWCYAKKTQDQAWKFQSVKRMYRRFWIIKGWGTLWQKKDIG
jgi:hypothetical protein